MKYSIKLDTKKLEDALQKIKHKVSGDDLGKAALAGLFTLEAHGKLNVRKNFNQQTGHLASAWETKLDKVSAKSVKGHTSPLAVYARIQELGGVIRATNARALHFQTADGEWHTVKAVTIPARPFLRPAADENKSDISKSITSVLHDLIEDASHG